MVGKQKVIDWVFVQGRTIRAGYGSNLIRLACGHNITRSASRKVPPAVQCTACKNGEPTDKHIRHFDECKSFAELERKARTQQATEFFERVEAQNIKKHASR